MTGVGKVTEKQKVNVFFAPCLFPSTWTLHLLFKCKQIPQQN